MSLFNTNELIGKLQQDVEAIIASAKELNEVDEQNLNKQPSAGKWSVAQVVEHLNSYNRYYLPAMNAALQKGIGKNLPYNTQYHSGWFGDYFTKMMLPKADGKIANKMNAPKDHQPIPKLDVKKVLAEFIAGQTELLNHLQQAKETNMGRIRVPISISKLIKLKLGDTFRFLIAHQQRHFLQIHNTLQSLGLSLPVKHN